MISTPFPPEREPRALPAGDHALDGARPEHVLYSYGYPAEETSHFWDYWRVIRRRRWTIITAFLVLVIAVTVTSFSARPAYRASATLSQTACKLFPSQNLKVSTFCLFFAQGKAGA